MAGGILFIDDNEADCDLMRVALEEARYAGALRCETDAVRALGQLSDPGKPLPDLVLLDLNMPRMHGKDVLRGIRAQSRLAGLRVVVFTTSNRPSEAEECRRLGADDYVVKPADFDALVILAQRFSREAGGRPAF